MSSAPFVPQLLLGAEHVRPADKAAIRDFLGTMFAHRRFPLHMNSLWNALYFDWTPDGGYVGLPLERIETRRHGACAPVVPVGGFVCIESGSGQDIWAEVVYKEGRHLLVESDGTVPTGGAATKAADFVDRNGAVVAVLREALVLDQSVLGKPTTRETALVSKLQRRSVRLDRFQHLVMEAVYDPDDVELDDATLYARYLFTGHHEGLLAEFVKDGTPDTELYAALITSLRAVADIVAGMPEVLAWNGYFWLKADYEAMANDIGTSSLAGRALLETVLSSVAFLPSRPWQPVLTAVGPRIVEWFERGSGLTETKHALLDGTGYARLVCLVNAYVADRVRQARDGVVKAGHVRLEDPWQCGGVWGSYPIRGVQPAWMRIPCTIPIGASRPDLPGTDEVAAELSAPRVAEPAITVKRSQRNWRLALSAGAYAGNELPVSQAIEFFDGAVAEVRLRLSVEGASGLLIDAPVTLDRQARVLSNVPWPLDFYPGIRIAAWVQQGGQVVRAHVTRRAEPLQIDGHRLPYELDEGIYRRALRLDDSVLRRAVSLSELIGRVFRRCGELVGEQTYALRLMDIAVAFFGAYPRAEDVRPILAELWRMGLARDDEGRYIWAANRITRATRVTDRALLEAYGETGGGVRLRRAVRQHWVRMHLRRWDHKDPSRRAEREVTYAAAIARWRTGHRLAPPLPAGHTYVEAYEKGGAEEAGAC